MANLTKFPSILDYNLSGTQSISQVGKYSIETTGGWAGILVLSAFFIVTYSYLYYGYNDKRHSLTISAFMSFMFGLILVASGWLAPWVLILTVALILIGIYGSMKSNDPY
jgi:hypothetical protein